MAKRYDLTKLVNKVNYFEIEESSFLSHRYEIKFDIGTNYARHIKEVVNILEEIGIDGTIEIVDFDEYNRKITMLASTSVGELLLEQYPDLSKLFDIDKGVEKLILWVYVWHYNITCWVSPLTMEHDIKTIAKKVEEYFNTKVRIGENYNNARYTITVLLDKHVRE